MICHPERARGASEPRESRGLKCGYGFFRDCHSEKRRPRNPHHHHNSKYRLAFETRDLTPGISEKNVGNPETAIMDKAFSGSFPCAWLASSPRAALWMTTIENFLNVSFNHIPHGQFLSSRTPALAMAGDQRVWLGYAGAFRIPVFFRGKEDAETGPTLSRRGPAAKAQ